MTVLPPYQHDLAGLPSHAVLRSVTATPGQAAGRTALRVSLTDEVARDGIPGVDYIDRPTMVLLPVTFVSGRIEVAVLSQLTASAPDYARGFAGVAYHVAPAAERFECVYLRPLNGTKTRPPAPRDRRGVQYFAYPDWPFDRLRAEHPDGRYEGAAPIAPGEWIRLSVDVGADAVAVSVDGQPILHVTETKVPIRSGRLGLFVDIGTEAWFADLRVTPN
jgi:hypothetical protein